MKKYFITALIFIIIIVFSSIFLIMNKAPNSFIEDYTISVSRGDTLSSISTILKNDGIIKNRDFLKAIAKISKSSSKLQVGHYTLKKHSSATNILKTLTTGKQTLIKVTISEGQTLREIALKLEEKQITTSDSFIDFVKNYDLNKYGINKIGAEGFLFPDTYMFEYNLPNKIIVEKFIDNFFQILNELNIKIDDSIYEKIILASIVEKEYKVDTEAPIIASVFKNRLKINMPLQSCATVVYVITDVLKKNHPERLFYSDLEIKSEYNTYNNYGLPPSPICNPGKIALKATFSDYKSDYLYFVLIDPENGKHSFSKNFSAHNKNYINYIQNKK